MIVPMLLLLAAQAAPAPAAQAAQPGKPAQAAPATPVLRAQYAWGYAGADGEGKGTLSLRLEPATGGLVLELHGLGERLVFLQGASGAYHLQIPRHKVDERAATLGGLSLPFLPNLGTVEALHRFLTLGEGPGVKVTRRDARGPVKMRYDGKDDSGHEVTVWLERTRWEPSAP